MVEEKDFITDRLSAAASEGRGNIQVPDEVCLGKLRNIIQLVQYLPTMQNDTLSDVSKELTNLSTSHQFTDFFVVQLMLVKSSQSAIFDPKFHDNYLAFLEKVDSESLYTEIVLTTGVICKAILHPEILLHPSSGDLLLRVIKNLGGWLAKMIISTNKFLSKPDIVDLESVIVEAYQLGLMTKIIPFVLEVLEPCRTSPIYQPPNPWIMKILNLLYEIYMMPNLKNWLRLSIERLLKKIGDLEQLNATSVLLKKLRKMNNNQDFEPFVVKRFDGKATYDPPLESLGKDLFKEFSVTIKKPDLFFGDYPELVRKLEDVLLEVLGKIGPLFIRLATTLGYETVEASALIANSYRNSRTDRIVVTPEIIVFMDKVEATKASAKKYRQDIDKTFLSGWMSYLVGDLLQQQGIPYALQPEIVESVIDENFECIREKLEICGDEEAIRYSIELAFRKPRLGENIMKEINEALEKEVDVDAMSSCLDIVLKSDEEKLAALCEAICNQFTVEHDPPSLYISRNKMAYLDPFVKRREGGQRDLLHALEAFWEKSSALRGFEDLVLNGFISTGYLSEEVIQEWYDDSSKRDENDAWYESLGSMFEVLAKQTLARLGEKLAAPVARDDLEEFIDSI